MIILIRILKDDDNVHDVGVDDNADKVYLQFCQDPTDAAQGSPENEMNDQFYFANEEKKQLFLHINDKKTHEHVNTNANCYACHNLIIIQPRLNSSNPISDVSRL